MSIKFTGSKKLSISSNSLLANVSGYSISFFILVDDPLIQNNFVLDKDFYTTFYSILLSGVTPGTVRLKTGYRNIYTTEVNRTIDIPASVVNHIVAIYDQGSQQTYVNGKPYSVGSLTGVSQTTSRALNLNNWASIPNTGYSFQVYDLAIWHDRILTQNEINNLRDRVITPPDITGYTNRAYWTLNGPVGSSVAISDSGVKNKYGVDAYNFSSFTTGTGTAIYSDPLSWSATVDLDEAYITTGGECIVYRFKSGGLQAIPISLMDNPVVYKNGVQITGYFNKWLTSVHTCCMFFLPSGESISTSDSVTTDTSIGWMETNLGFVNGVSGYAVDNRVNKSSFGVESLEKTLKVGFNFSNGGIGYECPYYIPKNLRYRLGKFTGSSVDSNLKPTGISASPSTASLHNTSQINGIDGKDIPAPTGFYCVAWDVLDTGNPITFGLSNVSNTKISERLDVRNYGGINGSGQNVRVFDVQLLSSTGSLTCKFSASMTCASLRPNFDNLIIYGPKDFTFTSGVALTIDKSDPYALSNIILDRLGTGAGSLRWMDTILEYAGSSKAIERGETHEFTDFHWGWGAYKKYYTLPHLFAQPYNTGLSPYIYSPVFGSSYPATLVNNIGISDDILNISDANTAPVIYGSRLIIDSEIMRVVNVTGSQVNVIRGINNTTPASHNSGVIQVGYRIPAPSYLQLALGPGGHIIELVTSGVHKISTGLPMSWANSWPTFAFTDGTTRVITSFAATAWVTSASSYVVAAYHDNASPVTLSGTVNLDPSTHRCNFGAPDMPQHPFSFAALATSKISDCDLHINLPGAATNDLIYYLAEQIRDNFPSDRRVYVELSNEVWNFGFVQYRYFTPLTNIFYPGQIPYAYLLNRSKEIWDIFVEKFDEGGRNRGGQIHRTINVQTVTPDIANGILNYAATNNIRIDAMAVAPYIDTNTWIDETNGIETANAFRWATTKQALDLYIHHAYYNEYYPGQNYRLHFQVFKQNINTYNNSTGFNCKLIAYEGGNQRPIPNDVAYSREKAGDFQYHPNMRIIEQDLYALWQRSLDRYSMFTYANEYYKGIYMWAVYYHILQDYGMGDGSDGKLDNTLISAVPSSINYKTPGVSQDQVSVSVRGQAFREWNAAVRANSNIHHNRVIWRLLKGRYHQV